MKPTVRTPLATALHYLDATQEQLAARMGIRQSGVSRALRRCSPAMAARVIAALGPDAARIGLCELHLIYPARYPDWRPSS